MDTSLIVGGMSRSGKTTTTYELVKNSNEVVVVLAKEKRALARNMAKWCVETSNRCIYDDADDTERVFPLSILPRTNDPFEQNQNIDGLIECLMRRRGAANADQNPLLETVTEHWANLIYELDRSIDISLFRAGRVDANSESGEFWNEISPGFARERTVGPTERLCSVLRKPCIASRVTRDGNRFLEMIDDGYSYFLEGGDKITQSEFRFLIGTRINEIVRYKRSGGTRNIVLVIEESEALGLTQQEAVALQTLHKTGLRWILVCQEPKWD